MVEVLNIEGYWRFGGKLNKHSLQKAENILSEQAAGKKPEMKDSSLIQAANMARFSNVPINPEQKFLYAVLREMTDTEGYPDNSPEEPTTMPWALSDQQLLAEAIRLTGDEEKLSLFKRAHPHIFPEVKP